MDDPYDFGEGGPVAFDWGAMDPPEAAAAAAAAARGNNAKGKRAASPGPGTERKALKQVQERSGAAAKASAAAKGGSQAALSLSTANTSTGQRQTQAQRAEACGKLAKPNPSKQKKAAAAKNKFLQNAKSQAGPNPAVSATPLKVPAAGNEDEEGEGGGLDVISPAALMRGLSTKRSADLAKAHELAPASNIMEAQERGEQLQAVDDASYALDGLGPSCSTSVRHESAATLAAICTSRRGLSALLVEGLMPEVLGALEAGLKKPDAVLALGAAAVILGAAQPNAEPSIICMPEMLSLVCRLLTEDQFLSPVGAEGESVVKLQRILCEGPLSRLIPATSAQVPNAVTLLAMSGVTDPHNEHRVPNDGLKAGLQKSGVLQAVAELSVRVSSSAALMRAPSPDKPSASASREMFVLQHCMLVMEHSTFCFSSNVLHLCNLKVATPAWERLTLKTKCRFGQAAVRILARLKEAWEVNKPAVTPSVRAAVAVLMNLTHSNTEGVRMAADTGVCDVAVTLLRSICDPGGGSGGLRMQLLQGAEVLSLLLGFLINLVEGDTKSKGTIVQHPAKVVQLLCQIVICGGQKSDTDGGDEVTADDLEIDEAEGEASIVEVYAAMLLGFLVEADSSLRKEAAALLPGNSLEPVVSAIERCLEFYVRADAITQATSSKLKKLIDSLKSK